MRYAAPPRWHGSRVDERAPADQLTILRMLRHPDCPWEPARSESPRRLLSVDRFLAFAYSQGVALDGLEPTADAMVLRLGGRRKQGGGLPYYHLPAAAAPGRRFAIR